MDELRHRGPDLKIRWDEMDDRLSDFKSADPLHLGTLRRSAPASPPYPYWCPRLSDFEALSFAMVAIRRL